jgi:hypothetical protein
MRPIRVCIDILVVGSATAALVLALRLYESKLDEVSAIDSTKASLSQIEAEIGIRSALGDTSLNEFGHPSAIDRAWFIDHDPTNALASDRAPWIECALPGEFSRDHPRDPTFRGGRGAMFWYNPIRGVIRARVPESASDESARILYETVNGDAWR